jgi:hypothetical protein
VLMLEGAVVFGKQVETYWMPGMLD